MSGRNFTSWLLRYRWIEVSHDGNKYCYKSGHFPPLPKTVIWQRITWNKNWFVKEFLLRCSGIGGISAVAERRFDPWPCTVEGMGTPCATRQPPKKEKKLPKAIKPQLHFFLLFSMIGIGNTGRKNVLKECDLSFLILPSSLSYTFVQRTGEHFIKTLLRITWNYPVSAGEWDGFSTEVKTRFFPCSMWQVERLAGLLYGFADLTQTYKNDCKFLIHFMLQHEFWHLAKI